MSNKNTSYKTKKLIREARKKQAKAIKLSQKHGTARAMANIEERRKGLKFYGVGLY